MRPLSDTIERLARLKNRPMETGAANTGLVRLESAGLNPGALTGWLQAPAPSDVPPALVVVLHGCTQTAAGYDHGSGWSKLAGDYGFAVLFPEQSRQNNPNLCFNWFVEQDIRRDHGEVLSIREMIGSVVSRYGIDPRRIHVTGLSAGGAMAHAMLATYPELFAGGAIIAGLPHASASTIPEAFDRMRGHGTPSATALQAKLKASSSNEGPWPAISIWQGTADTTVVPANAQAIVDQWRDVHGLSGRPDLVETVDGHSRKAWKDGSGRQAVELYEIKGMGHGTPVDPSTGYGTPGPYMLDAGISSTVRIARNWGLVASFEEAAPATTQSPAQAASSQGLDTVKTTIENALRAAGLMK